MVLLLELQHSKKQISEIPRNEISADNTVLDQICTLAPGTMPDYSISTVARTDLNPDPFGAHLTLELHWLSVPTELG